MGFPLTINRAIRTCLLVVGLGAILFNLRQADLATRMSDRSLMMLESSAHVIEAQEPWPTNNDEENDENQYSLFLVENLKRSKRVPCGFYKCFFAINDEIGYLVTPRSSDRIVNKMGSEWFEILEGSWHYAQYLRQKYKIQHFLLEPPALTTVTPELYSVLNENLWFVEASRETIHERYQEGSTVIVQKVQKAPEPNLLFGSFRNKHDRFLRKIDKFVKTYVTDNKVEFGRNFFKNLRDTKTLVENEPCLAYDFQLMLDRNGNLYQLDLERCLQPNAKNHTERTDEVLDEVETAVQHALILTFVT